MDNIIVSEKSISQSILETLLAESGNERRRQSIIRVKEACDALEAKGRTFKLSDIQKMIENKHGTGIGPKAQSISNERVRTLGLHHYVEARTRELNFSKLKNNSGRSNHSESMVQAAINKIDDIDTRSKMHDVYDRLIVAENGLKRAKVIFKGLQPGIDPENFLNGQAQVHSPNNQTIPQQGISALKNLILILRDEEKLNAVGLSFDGRRIRRKTGTRDEFIDPITLEGLNVLKDSLS